MKAILLIATLLISQILFAKVSIPKGEQERMLGQQIAELTDLIQDDAKYPQALTKCAEQEPEAKKYFFDLRDAYLSDEFAALPPQQQKEETTMVRIAIKMLCRDQIENAGIEF